MQTLISPKVRRNLTDVEMTELNRLAAKGKPFFMSLLDQALSHGLTEKQVAKLNIKVENDNEPKGSVGSKKQVVLENKTTEDDFFGDEMDVAGYTTDPEWIEHNTE
jgi:hypothetical protein